MAQNKQNCKLSFCLIHTKVLKPAWREHNKFGIFFFLNNNKHSEKTYGQIDQRRVQYQNKETSNINDI